MAIDFGKNLSVAIQVARINANLKRVADKCVPPVRQALIIQAKIIAEEIKQVAPVSDVDPTAGNLKTSVRVEEGEPNERKVVVIKVKAGGVLTQKGGGGYDYARAEEFGTVKEKAHPFFFPVWRALKAGARRAGRNAVKAEVLKVFK